MNRGIKFRAWDTFDNKMICNSEECIKLMLIPRPDRYIQMQFTGLLDKNGKPIYEGDILAGGEPIDGEPRRGVIKWATTNYTAHYDFGILPSHIYCEVIGNIWENPKLLEEKNDPTRN
mgnify:CR=1 FL=1